MTTSLNALVEVLDGVLGEYGATRARRLAGQRPTPSEDDVLAAVPAISDREVYARVLESLARLDATDVRVDTLARLKKFLLEAALRAALAGHTRGALSFGATTMVPAGATELPLEVAVLLASQVTSPELTAQAIETALETRTSATSHALGEANDFAGKRGFQTFDAFAQEATGIDLGAWSKEADDFLAATDDAFFDFFAYVHKKAGQEKRPGELKWFETRRVTEAGLQFENVGPREAWDAALRTIEDAGLPPISGRVLFDRETNPLRPVAAAAVAIAVPDEVRFIARTDRGLWMTRALLEAHGEAAWLSRVGRNASVLKRRLGDATLRGGLGAAFADLTWQPLWLSRALRFTKSQAREAARHAAFFTLSALRHEAALVAPRRLAVASADRGKASQAYVEQLHRAYHARFAPALFALECTPLGSLDRFGALRRWAVGAHLRDSFCQRFNEDYFRNPATGRFLADKLDSGEPLTAEAFCAELAPGALSLRPVARALVESLGA